MLLLVGYRTLAVTTILSLIRLLFPIELPFTTTILYSCPPSKAVVFLQHRWNLFSFLHVSIFDLLLIVWVIGIIRGSSVYFMQYRKISAFILLHGKEGANQERYSAILNSVCTSLAAKNRFQVMEIAGLSTPMIFSVFKPTILLPANHTYTDQELFFIFQHEISHSVHGDLLVKFFLQILTIVYWWNPLSASIKAHMNRILELNIDAVVTHNDRQAIADYLSCLLAIKKQAVNSKPTPFLSSIGLSIAEIEGSELETRFQVLANQTPQRKSVSSGIIGVSILFFLISYLFIWEPSQPPSLFEPESSYFQMTEENSYVIQNPNGTYDFYWNGQLIETVDSLQYYDESIPIYQSKEDVP